MKTDDLLEHPESFERRLGDGLDHIANANPVARPGPFDPDTRPVERHVDARSVRWFVGAAAAAVVVVGVGGLVILGRGDDSSNAPTDKPSSDVPLVDSSDPTVSVATARPNTSPADGQFGNGQPVLTTPLPADQTPLVALDGAVTTYAQSMTYPGPFDGTFTNAAVLIPADDSWDLPRIATYRTERSPANGNETLDISQFGEPVEVGGTIGYLATETSDVEADVEGLSHLLFFEIDESHYVSVNAAGLGADELVSIVDTYDPESGKIDVPDGYRMLPMPGHQLNSTIEFRYDLNGSEIELRGSNRGAGYLLGIFGNSRTVTQNIDGIEVAVRSGADGPNRYTASWINADWAFHANLTGINDPAEIRDLLRTFRLVDDATFSADFEGPGVVTGSTRAAEVEAMLADVPLPSSLDVGDLIDRQGANVRYQEIAAVSGAVACSWMDIYFDSIESNPDAARAAADALATSTQWDMLLEIDDQGGWSGVLWDTAAAINGDGLIPTGAGGQAPTKENTYPGLGCDTR